MKEKIIFAILISSLAIPSAFASISCQNCLVGECQCAITDCAKGLVDIYYSSNCFGNPVYEFSFTENTLPWFPDTSGTYFFYALCDDSHTHSACTNITVFSSSTQTTSSETITTTETVNPTEPTPAGNSNIVLYVLVIIIIVVIAFILYRLLSKKKKSKIDYETLYRKWGR